MDETSLKEYAALAQLTKANKRANGILIILFILLFLAAVYGMLQLYQSQQDAFKKRTAANNATQKEIRTMTLESIRYQTCIGVVPIEQRTPAAQRECFHKADLPGGLTENDFITVPPEVKEALIHDSAGASPKASSGGSSAPGASQSSSSQSAPSTPPTQANNSQQKPTPLFMPPGQGLIRDSVPILGGL